MKKRQIIGLVSAFLASFLWLYILISPKLAEPLYYPVLFQSTTFPVGQWNKTEICGIVRQDCYFPGTGDNMLNGWFFQRPHSTKTILLSHGRGGNLTDYLDLVELLLKSGASVFVYDYEGYGKSEGRPSLAEICRDGLSSYDYLTQKRHIPKDQIIAYGQSLGTGVSCFIADNRPCSAIVLQSGFSSLEKIGDDTCPLLAGYPPCLLFNQHFDNLKVLSKPHPPLLLLHGMKDNIIPVSHSEEMYKYSLEPKAFACMPHADHDDGWNTDAGLFISSLQSFMSGLPNQNPTYLSKNQTDSRSVFN